MLNVNMVLMSDFKDMKKQSVFLNLENTDLNRVKSTGSWKGRMKGDCAGPGILERGF